MNAKPPLLLIFSCLCEIVLSQTTVDCYSFRSYNHSLLFESISETEVNQLFFSDYGQLMSFSSSADVNNSYLYQGQEYLKEMDIYLYPGRIYSQNALRFFQPDPANQYFSPYLFVGSDPVNYIDYDGREGKPLAIYQVDYNYRNGIRAGTLDIMSEVPNAHYVPMHDFLNGQVGDLQEWNGNVFFQGHTWGSPGREMMVERGANPTVFKASSPFIQTELEPNGRSWRSLIDADEVGRKLRMFADQRKVNIKNITFGSCHGEKAAQGVSDGFLSFSRLPGEGGRPLQFLSANKDTKIIYTGEKTLQCYQKVKFDVPPEHTKMFTGKGNYDVIVPRSYTYKDKGKQFRGWGEKFDPNAPPETLPETKPGELEAFMNGRTPESMVDKFVKDFAEY